MMPARARRAIAAWLAGLMLGSSVAPVRVAFASPADRAAAPEAATAPASTAGSIAGASPDSVAAPASADTTSGSPLERARELLSDGDYDHSIELLKPELARAAGDPERLRATYLLLIKTYVFLGNDLKFKPQGREASNLNYQEARRLIAECLGIRELRHTEPTPASQYPPEMIAFFTETRRAIFGAFRVRELSPASATVLFDADTLRALPGEAQVGDVDIPIGPHVVVVRAPGFKELTDRITIEPDVTLDRGYRLEKNKGTKWYATRGLGALGIVAGAIALIAGGGGGDTTEPLPTVPDPPPSK